MSKGSGRRPARVSPREYADNYTRTFGTGLHQNPPHPDTQTFSTATQAVELKITHRSTDGKG